MHWEPHTCTVCSLLDADDSQKDCVYCSRCNAWICRADLNRWDRRARAAAKQKARGG